MSRRLLLPYPFFLLTLSVLGCGPSRAAWRAHLSSVHVERVAGSWQLTMRIDAADSTHRAVTSGRLALTVNDAGLNASGVGARPDLFGTYDVDFSPLHFQPGAVSGVPAVVGVIRGDSLVLALAPSSDLPVELRGTIAGDSITGRWSASARADPGATGDFVLRR